MEAAEGAATVYNLAADMGGMGFIENNKALCMLSVLINTHLLHGRARCTASSGSSTPRRRASTPPTSRRSPDVIAAERGRRLPGACPRTATAGRSCSASGCAATSARTSASQTRVARYHNVYGPHGTWDGGREKAPAAICRKVIEAVMLGRATRSRSGATASRRAASCTSTTASRALGRSCTATSLEPINLGSAELVTINQLVDIVEEIAGVTLEAPLQAGRAAGRSRSQQRQHQDPRSIGLAARHRPPRRPGADVPLDPR